MAYFVIGSTYSMLFSRTKEINVPTRKGSQKLLAGLVESVLSTMVMNKRSGVLDYVRHGDEFIVTCSDRSGHIWDQLIPALTRPNDLSLACKS